MSEIKLISPMLDNFVMGDPFSDHHGVRSCPAMDELTGKKYIVKIISTPSSASQLDALLLSGAYSSKEDALAYYEGITNGILEEVSILQKLSALEGFMAFDNYQTVPMEDGNGFDIYLLGSYKHSLERSFRKGTMTHLSALNLGLDLCAALTICRKSGYLFVNLKPNNIYLTVDNGFRIGDLGFMKLDTLQYASLPDRYRSEYTAPEIADAFSALNTTIDVYAVGLILYQAFNGGVLPAINPDEPLAAPDFADYEMAEIILKACAADPAERWQDPIEMGQALVGYMQRNGAHDTPIVPPPAAVEATVISEEPAEDAAPETDADTQEETVSEGNPDPQEHDTTDEAADVETSYTEDDFGNLSFLSDDTDETLPGMNEEDLEYEQVSVEVTDMLNQADALIAHPTPDPVIPPEPIDVQIPPLPEEATEPEEVPETAENGVKEPDEDGEVSEETAQDNDNEPESDVEADEAEEDEVLEEAGEKPKRRWLRNTLIVVLSIIVLAAGFLYYKLFYLQPIESIVLDGNETKLVVQVDSKVNENLLSVVCSDTYGNKIIEPVTDGMAVFTDLAPNSAYTVKVVVKGFHRLTGDTSTAYSTPVQTNIAQFNAVTGQTDGSVILKFTVEGPDAQQWKVTYCADGEAETEQIFSGHMLEIPALTVGKEYTFTLEPAENLFYTGVDEIKHTVSNLILAEDLVVSNYQDKKLSVSWSAPADTDVSSWTVHCYSEKGYDETIVTEQPSASFENIDESEAYTIEVAALGMSVNQRILIAENSIPVTDFKISSTDEETTVLTWVSEELPEDVEWILSYTVDGSPAQEVTGTSENSIEIGPMIPGAKYRFILKTSSGLSTLGGVLYHNTSKPKDFDGYSVVKENIELNMCLTPEHDDWDRYDLDDSDFTTTFSIGEKASFLIHLLSDYDISSDIITTHYVIRDESSTIVSLASESDTWSSMWYRRYGEFDLPALPAAAGSYTVSIYFNDGLAGEQAFTMTE